MRSAIQFVHFMHSVPGRLLLVSAGGALLWLGAMHPTFWGLILMMVGLLPLVIGVSNESPLDGLLDSAASSRRRQTHHRVRDHHA